MSIALSPLQLELRNLVREWAGDREPRAEARARTDGDPTSPDTWARSKQWDELVELGALSAHLPESVGGLGESLAEAAVVVAELGEALAGLPVTTTVAASAVVAASSAPDKEKLLARFAEGARGTIGFEPTLNADGGLGGSTGPVLGAAEADLFVLGAGDHWYLVEADAVSIDLQPGNDPTRSIGTVTCTGSKAIELPGVTTSTVRAIGAAMAVAELAGAARWATDTAVAYAKVREQFGVLIGSFQAIKHILARMEVDTQVLTAAAWDVAGLIGTDGAWDAEAELAATSAAAVGWPAALEVTKNCIQVLGGIGYTWEHDAHFYLRRAKMWQSLLGHEVHWQEQLGSAVLGGFERHPAPLDLDVELDADLLAAIDEIKNTPAEQRRRKLMDAGLIRPTWAKPYGRGASTAENMAIAAALEEAGIQVPDLVIAGWIVPAIVRAGTEEQLQRFIEPSLMGEITWCQLFSEPSAGSDLASLRTRATRTEGGWKINGQKVWTSNAHSSDWGMCLARSNPDVPKHKGITAFLIDMKSPGVDIRPLREGNGETLFNEVFFDDVFVPDELQLGEEGEGWRLATGSLAQERVDMGSRRALSEDMDLVLDCLRDDPGPWTGLVGELVARSWVKAAGDRRMAIQALADIVPDAKLATVTKLIGVALDQDVREAMVTVLGPRGAVADDTGGHAESRFLSSRALSIAGGSTQILLNVLAERSLGLPRG
ncbi:acyl-CoA dehydrogenase [Enemella sp. A6]|uniref:acyl-CoA dehydrogenase n=1 Tax=Enemella sp. A6 TaxID=3440152 RepID=UPI003EBD0358